MNNNYFLNGNLAFPEELKRKNESMPANSSPTTWQTTAIKQYQIVFANGNVASRWRVIAEVIDFNATSNVRRNKDAALKRSEYRGEILSMRK